MSMQLELSVVVPMLNEGDNVVPLVREIFRALRDLPFELILVDDGSVDDTVAKVRLIAADYPGLRLLRHRHPRGQSTAVWAGVQAARSPWIAVLDGDLQNDPADLLNLLAVRGLRLAGNPGLPAPGLLIGHRQQRQDTPLRRWSSRIANGLRSWLLRDGTPDAGCGLKLISRSLFLQLPYFDHMHRFMPALVKQLGHSVESVPVTHRPRRAGRSKYGISNRLWVGIVDLLGVAWLARRNRRAPCLEEELHQPSGARRQTCTISH